MSERTDYRFTPEQTLKSLWTRIGTAAKAEGVSIEELAKRSDREFMRLPNVGELCLAALRQRYPSPDAAAGAVTEVNRLLGEMAAKRQQATLVEAIDALRGLVDRLDEIAAHEGFKAVWTLNMIHGGVYNGPSWAEPLERARKALKEAGG